MQTDDYARGLVDELAMHRATGNAERGREVLAELHRVAPDLAAAHEGDAKPAPRHRATSKRPTHKA